jgi:hypothetical protein
MLMDMLLSVVLSADFGKLAPISVVRCYLLGDSLLSVCMLIYFFAVNM